MKKFLSILNDQTKLRAQTLRRMLGLAYACGVCLGSGIAVAGDWSPTQVLDSSAYADTKYDDSARTATDGQGNWVSVWQSSGLYGSDFDLLVSRSSNNGLSWSAPVPVSPNANSDASNDVNAAIATDKDGNWIIAWQANNGIGGTLGSDFDIIYARSTNNGQTWSFPAPLNQNAASDTGFDGNVALDCDGNGSWVAVWTSLNIIPNTTGNGQHLLVAVSGSNGAIWSTQTPLDQSQLAPSQLSEAVSLDLKFSGNGTYIATAEFVNNGDFDIAFYRSTNQGITWTLRQALNSYSSEDLGGDFSPRLATDGRGNWLATWYTQDTLNETKGFDEDILVARSLDDGISWGPASVLNSAGLVDSRNDRLPYIITDTYGNWLVAWNSNDDIYGIKGLDYDIMYSRSTNVGVDWSVQTVLNDSGTTDSGTDAQPHISADGTGHWVATWHTNDTLGNTIGDDSDILCSLAEFEPIISDLRVEGVALPNTLYAGAEFDVVATVTNDGPSTAANILLVDELPAGATFISAVTAAGLDCTVEGTTVVCSMGDLEAGQDTSATIRVQPFIVGTAAHQLHVASDAIDLQPANDSATVQATVNSLTDVVVDISASGNPVLLQNVFTYTIAAHNNGPSPATTVIATVTLPSNIEVVGTPSGPGDFTVLDGSIEWAIGTMADGADKSATITVRPTTLDAVTASVAITTADPESDEDNNSDSVEVQVIPAIDLSLTMSDAPDPMFVTTPLTYTLVVTNHGPSTATGITVTNPIPVDATFDSASGAPYAEDGTSVTYSIASLAKDTSTVLILVIRPQVTGEMANSASVSGVEAEQILGNNQAQSNTLVRPPADVRISVAPSLPQIPVLDLVSYTVTVTNDGPSSATGLVVNTDLPAQFDYVSGVSPVGTWATVAQSGTWTIGNLATGDSAQIVVTAKAMEDGLSTFTVNATLVEFDDDLVDNSANAVVNITSSGADIAGTWLSVLQRCARENCKLTYQWQFTNEGIADSAPARMRIFLSSDAIVDGGDLTVGEFVLFPKKNNVNKPKILKKKFKLPAGVVGTGKVLIGVFDADSNVGEQSERNNTIVSDVIL